MNKLLEAIPRTDRDVIGAGKGQIHDVDCWSLDQGASEPILTFRLSDDASIAFQLRTWQITAIASTVALGAPRPSRLN
jgi:hypothetical protein